MNITITDLSGLKDAITAAGIKSLLEGAGIAVEVGQIGNLPSAPAPIAAVAVEPTPERKAKTPRKLKAESPIPARLTRQLAPPPAKPKAAAKSAPESDAPRITVRQRITDLLKTGPKTASEAANALRDQGVNTDAHLIGQHFYLMVRDGLAERDETVGGWRLI